MNVSFLVFAVSLGSKRDRSKNTFNQGYYIYIPEGSNSIEYNVALIDLENSDIAAVSDKDTRTKYWILEGFWTPKNLKVS